jgi:hypothetical protein
MSICDLEKYDFGIVEISSFHSIMPRANLSHPKISMQSYNSTSRCTKVVSDRTYPSSLIKLLPLTKAFNINFSRGIMAGISVFRCVPFNLR